MLGGLFGLVLGLVAIAEELLQLAILGLGLQEELHVTPSLRITSHADRQRDSRAADVGPVRIDDKRLLEQEVGIPARLMGRGSAGEEERVPGQGGTVMGPEGNVALHQYLGSNQIALLLGLNRL